MEGVGTISLTTNPELVRWGSSSFPWGETSPFKGQGQVKDISRGQSTGSCPPSSTGTGFSLTTAISGLVSKTLFSVFLRKPLDCMQGKSMTICMFLWNWSLRSKRRRIISMVRPCGCLISGLLCQMGEPYLSAGSLGSGLFLWSNCTATTN